MTTYRFLSQLFEDFVNIFYILFYVKEILFTCVIYAANFYHQSECDIPDFECSKCCCDLDMGIITWFTVIDNIVMNLFPYLGHVIYEAEPLSLFFFGIVQHTYLPHTYLT